jgi:hypothetical protein
MQLTVKGLGLWGTGNGGTGSGGTGSPRGAGALGTGHGGTVIGIDKGMGRETKAGNQEAAQSETGCIRITGFRNLYRRQVGPQVRKM